MDTKVISPELAKEEVTAWLDRKKISTKKRETHADAIEELVAAIIDGTINIDAENRIIKHRLLFPIVAPGTEEVSVGELTYKERLSISEIKTYTKNVKATDADGRITAYVAALTGKPSGILDKLDTADNTIAQSVAVFFL